MKRTKTLFSILLALFCVVTLSVSAQESKPENYKNAIKITSYRGQVAAQRFRTREHFQSASRVVKFVRV